MPCTPGRVLSQQVGVVGPASAPISDAPFNPGQKGLTFVFKGATLVALSNAANNTQAWTTLPFSTTFVNTVVNPVQLSDGKEYLFFVNGTTVFKYDNTGAQLAFKDLASLARSSCPKAQPGDLSVIASPTVQVCAFSNTTFQPPAPATCTTANDLVIVPTHFLNCDGYNRIVALRASDLALPGSGGVGAPGWSFGNSSTYIIDPASDSCQIIYDSTGSAPPFNNTVVCGTDQTNPLHSSLWALNTHTTGAFAHLGARIWSVDGGKILGGPVTKFNTTRIYYGTDNGPGSGTFRVKNLSNGSDIYSVPVASPIDMVVWPEFRPPDPGLTNMSMVTTADGVFRRFVESNGAMVEAAPTTGRPNKGNTAGMFKTAAAVLPSAGRVYVGEDNGTVRQMDATVCDQPTSAANEGFIEFPNKTQAFNASLDFDDYQTSTDIDRVTVANLSGDLLRFCVPFGDGSDFFAQQSVPGAPPPEPNAGCTTPSHPGNCTCDTQCANYAPPSSCYKPVCQFRNGATEGVCVLAKAANGTTCDNKIACDCSPAAASANGGSCPATCPNGNCDVCTDGVCVGTVRSNCACNKVGDAACDASLGQGCCGNGVCADLRSSNSNCGACGNVCGTGFVCQNGHCARNLSFCKAPDAAALNKAAASLPGGASLEYTFNAGTKECPALVNLMNSDLSGLATVDAASAIKTRKFLNSNGTALPFGGNGASSLPDGKAWWANVVETGKTAYLEVVQDPFGAGGNLDEVLQVNGVQSPQVPFGTTAYNSGFENRPAANLLEYQKNKVLMVFLANALTLGDIRVVNPATKGGGTPDKCVPGFCTASTAISALDYSIRLNGDGVLLAAIGTSLYVICDPATTNAGNTCQQATFNINLTDTTMYPNKDPSGAAYMTIDRIYSIAVDRQHASIYLELGSASQESQVVVIEDLTLAGNRAVIRNIVDIEEERGLDPGKAPDGLQRVWTKDFGGRLAISRNGWLVRMALNRTQGGPPLFYSGEIQ